MTEPRTVPGPPGFPAQIPSPTTLAALHEVMVGCTRCDLFLTRTQVVPGVGSPKSRIMIVGEAPGANEDARGEPFVGKSGALLDEMLAEAGLSRADVFIGNVIRCRPPANRNPKSAELRACSGWMREQLRILDPALVVVLGRFALQHFLPADRITAIQGELREVAYHGRTFRLFPVLHPSAILRNPGLRTHYAAQFRAIRGLLSA